VGLSGFEWVWVCLGMFGCVRTVCGGSWVCLGVFGCVWVCFWDETWLILSFFAC
jgi:hypothetical protein